MLPAIGPLRPWADPSVVEIGARLPAHVPLGGFDRRELDGTWGLELFDTPESVVDGAISGPHGSSIEVAVPGNWTMQELGGFVDLPHYTNVQMPFPGPPPRLPERNPTGVYRRSFRIPTTWTRRRTVLHIAGAESVHAVYVNGAFVAYGTDSRLPSEYDVTAHVVAGDNDIAIVVIRYSAQSYVEDQDQWWMAGLHRSVWLESRPNVHLADVPVDTDFDPETGRGSIAASAVVDFGSGHHRAGFRVRTTLRGPNGKRVGAVATHDVPEQFEQPYLFHGHRVTATWEVARAKPWTAETPDRYEVTFELLDQVGRVVQTEVQLVGLRRVEVRDRELLVNGQPIWVFGVNRHDHHPDRGKAVTPDDMRADLEVMRAHNISAVRTSHYPNDSAFYDLCDELGFYVIDEANIESHAYNTSLCDDDRFSLTWLARGTRMVRRDRNHPCVISWSLGNESGYGHHHDALAGAIRRLDPSRPLHYEGAVFHAGWVAGGRGASDLVCPMYPTIDAIREYGEAGDGDRPLIMCEYSHAMGNSNGSLADYWDVITSTPGLQGGFLWEWKDHGLRQRLPDGRVRLAYGGQFGDSPHDGNFVADGLVSADLEPHPAMREVAWVYRPVTVESAGRRRVRVTNRQSFCDLSRLSADWELAVEGQVVLAGRWPISRLAPGASELIDLPSLPAGAPRGEVTFSVRWTTRRDAWFAPAGHLVAWDQVVVRAGRRPAVPPSARPVDTAGTAAPGLTLMRAPIDNDGFKLMPELSRRIRVGGTALVAWQDAGIDSRSADELVGHEHTVEIRRDGSVVHRHIVDVPARLDDLARVGVLFAVPGRFGRLRWYGRGPHENYPDRNRSAMLGTWNADPDRSPYLVPQEFGLRTDCRWFELVDAETGERVRIDPVDPSPTLHVSATHHHPDELTAAATAIDLVPRDDLVVSLDVAHRGIGTASCGPDILPQYRLPTGRYEFAYRISLLDPSG